MSKPSDAQHLPPAPRRQPRPHPRAGRAREQPQERQRRDSQAPAHGVHGRVRLGQELARVRHVAAESRRLINETYSAFIQTFMPTLARPEVDRLEGLTPAIIVDQERMGANSRSTVGTATDTHAMLRILFSRLGVPSAGPSLHYSFNMPQGWCPRCEGTGEVSDIDLDELFDADKSLAEGAFKIPGYTPDGWQVRQFAESGFLDPEKKIRDYTETERHDFLYKEPTKIKIRGINITYEGLVPKITKSILSKDRESMRPYIREFVERAVAFTTCPECHGARLNASARASKIGGVSIADAAAMQVIGSRRVAADRRRPRRRAARRGTAADARLVRARSGLGYLVARPRIGHALRRRSAAHQDDPPPGIEPHRRHIRVRRAHGRAAPARHPAHERGAHAAARQGQHGTGRRAQARGHRDR